MAASKFAVIGYQLADNVCLFVSIPDIYQ